VTTAGVGRASAAMGVWLWVGASFFACSARTVASPMDAGRPSVRGSPPDDASGRVPPSARGVARGPINPRLLRRFRPIAQSTPATRSADPELISLGRMLWYEPRLSRDGTVSCNTCHALDAFGVDHRATSLGVDGQRGRRNAPSVYNAATHVAQFWDGRALSLEEQAAGPLLNPGEMGGTPASVEAALRVIPAYRDLFQKAFPGPRLGDAISLDHVARAISAFERGLVTRSRWEDYLAGNSRALTAGEIEGLRVFLDVGCMGCHTGPQVGASMFQVTGFVERWPNQEDLGRFEVTKIPADRMVFKVPTLKNVVRTSPYFHDGSIADLGTAIRIMGRHQLGIELGDQEVASIVSFFGALTGSLPAAYIAAPVLPGRGPLLAGNGGAR
jgi:cytochrome c peroxidase